MGISAKAILFGEINYREVAAVIREAFPGSADAMSFNVEEWDKRGYGYILFPEPNPTDERDAKYRQLMVFKGASTPDNATIYDGTRTLLNLNKWGSSSEILLAVLNKFGGYFLESDARENDWKLIQPPAAAFEASEPKERLKIELARDLPVGIANELAKLAEDEAALDKVLVAYAVFKKEQNIVDNLKLDELEPELENDGDEARVEWNFSAGPMVDITLTWTLPQDTFEGVVRRAPDPMADHNSIEAAPTWLVELLKKNVSDNPAATFSDLKQEFEEKFASAGPAI